MSSDVTPQAPLTSQHPPEALPSLWRLSASAGPPLPFRSTAREVWRRRRGAGGARGARGSRGGRPGVRNRALGNREGWRRAKGGLREGWERSVGPPPQGLVGPGLSRASLLTGLSGRDAERRRGVRGPLRASQVVSGAHSSEQPAAWIRKPLAYCVRWKNTIFCSRFCINILRKYVKGKVDLERMLTLCG